jgi:hypothetical protein
MVRLGVCASCGCEAGARWQFRATSFAEVAVSCGFSAEVAITCVFSAEVAVLGLNSLISVPKLPPRHARRTWLPPRHARRTWLPPRGLGRPSSGVVGRSDAGWDDVGRRRPPLRTRQVAMMCRHPREVALTCTWPPEVALTCTKQAKPAQIRHLGGETARNCHLGGETARNCHLERTPPLEPASGPPGTRVRTAPWNPRADTQTPRNPPPDTPGTPPPTSPPRRLTKDRSPSL